MFGRDYDDDISCTIAEMRQCKTIEERLQLSNDKELEEAARKGFVFSNEPSTASASTSASQNLDFPKEADPWDKWEESSAENDKSVASEATATRPGNKSAPVPVNPKEDHNHKDSAMKGSTSVPQDTKTTTPSPPSNAISFGQFIKQHGLSSTIKKVAFDMKNAFESPNTDTVKRGRNEYRFTYPSFECPCCASGSHLVTFGEPKYYDDCANTRRWWDSDMISSYAALLAHDSHSDPAKQKIQLMHVSYPNAVPEESECRELGAEVEQIASVCHANDHYSVLRADIATKKIFMYDGLHRSLKDWQNHEAD